MSSGTVDKQIAGERGELYVFGELLKRGAVSYVPLVDEGVDALVRTAEGAVIEIQVKAAGSTGGKYPRWFQMGHVIPRKNFLIIGVEFEKGDPKCAWIFPSIIFDKYASTPPKGSPRDLDLDSGIRKYGIPLKDLLCGFRDRWELIVEFPRFEGLMESPEDLEDVLTVREAEESGDEAISLKDYERGR
ncbi:MAG: hypothetical protein IH872_01150 [Chloroflexi bacterium]|nr:hypothetical protein [Chloroflexota bacterium]